MKWVDDLLEPLKESVALQLDDFLISFSEYLPKKYDQVGLVRTIVDIYKNVPIDTVYVPSTFAQGNTVIGEEILFERLERGESFTIEGFGGSGKSIFMRHLWRSLAKRSSRVPLLVELRNIDASNISLSEFIIKNCFGEAKLSIGQFEMLLGDGRFTVLLDGFDELGRNEKSIVEKEIIRFSENYPKASLVVTGRPDERFASWGRFQVIKVSPFDYSQFSELISKIEFDSDVKRAFQVRADKEFFELHREFLSNPLLALMMLVSFGENAEIPSRLSVFYRQCFDALFRKHDAMKQSYERQRTLDQIEFERFFSVFSFLSHQDKRTSFGDNYFTSTISDAMEYLRIPEEKKRGIEIDVIESVNLIAKEGDSYFYIHRSFQEYFAACCVTNVMVDEAPEALSFFAEDSSSTAFRLCCEMHEDLVKDKYLIPKYESLRKFFPVERKPDHPYYVSNIQSFSGGIDVQVWLLESGNKHIYLNGWMFNPRDEIDRLYRCVADLGGYGVTLDEQRFNSSIDVPRPLCNVPELIKGEKFKMTENGRLLLRAESGGIDFILEGIDDIEAKSMINSLVDSEKDECLKSLSELEDVLITFNIYLDKVLRRREENKKLILRPDRNN